MSAATSSTRMRQPSCSPKNVTLLPTTGPRSRMRGLSAPCRQRRNFWRALVGYDASVTCVTEESTTAAVVAHSARAKNPEQVGQRSGVGHDGFVTRRPSGPGAGPARRGAGGGRLGLRLGAGALHVDGAAEVRAFGNGDARRGDVAVHRAVVANVDLLRGGDVAGDFTEHDHRLREDLGLDLAVRANREHVVLQIDPAFDVAFDRQVFAPAQLAFDDDGLSDIHVVPPKLGTRLAGSRRSGNRRRGRRRRSLRRWRGRFDRLIPLPHR